MTPARLFRGGHAVSADDPQPQRLDVLVDAAGRIESLAPDQPAAPGVETVDCHVKILLP